MLRTEFYLEISTVLYVKGEVPNVIVGTLHNDASLAQYSVGQGPVLVLCKKSKSQHVFSWSHFPSRKTVLRNFPKLTQVLGSFPM